MTESLISFRYCTALVASRMMLGPVWLGPKPQILRASLRSKSKSSAILRARSLTSSRGPMPPFSISSTSFSSRGDAFTNRRLCLLGDLERHICEDSEMTVSEKDTTGSEMRSGAPPIKSSCRSLRQISRCSSPAPATMCSPVPSAVDRWTRGSDFPRRLRPSTSLGRSEGFLGSTATRTTADTENFMLTSGWVSGESARVPDLARYWSIPTRATVLPDGTSSMGSAFLPIMTTVRWIDLMNRSALPPNSWLAPMMRTFCPVATVPEKTRPKA
mmetsp:Transcript_4935/g.15937  ORF Transcript_4935/g.15937 Transcript_4935/m.15937 type:complete len:272 (-) Transcript_4935:1259-2074(-)